MPQSARTGMDQASHLAEFEVEGVRDRRLVYLIDAAHFEEVVPGAERTDLPAPAIVRELAHALGLCRWQAAALLGMFEIFRTRVSVAQRPPRALGHEPLQLCNRKVRDCSCVWRITDCQGRTESTSEAGRKMHQFKGWREWCFGFWQGEREGDLLSLLKTWSGPNSSANLDGLA